MIRFLPALVLGALASAPASAQETVDIGLIKNKDVAVVQKLLYPKDGATELGVAVGWMPFDRFTTTPMASLRYAKFFSEEWGFEVDVSGGWSLKNATYKELESPAYGIQPDAYRYLTGLAADVQWSPIYAKTNWRGQRVLHHDVYALAGVAATVEQAMMPDGDVAFSPGATVGVGMRFYLKSGDAIRVQLRDDLLIQRRAKTEDVQSAFFKQNVALTVGWSFMKRKG